MMRSTQQMIQDFYASGKDLPTFLSELNQTIQTKPEWKKIQELKAGQLSDAQKLAMQQQFTLKRDAISNQYATQRL